MRRLLRHAVARLLRYAVALVALVFGRRRRREPEEPEALAQELRLESTRPGQPTEPDEVRAERSERMGEEHERIRRRRAEPPPTAEREVEHQPRLETVVLLCLLGATVVAAGFIVFYVAFPDTQLLGLTVGLAFALLAVATVVAGKRLVPQEKVVEQYQYFGDEEDQEDVAEIMEESQEGVSRRRLIIATAGVAGATLGAAALFPAASLGPSVGERIFSTPWRRGRVLVDSLDEPIRADDVEVGTMFLAFPEGASRSGFGAPLTVVRIPEAELELPPERLAGAPEGILAFSRICPHAGCAISIYRHPLHDPVEPRPALVCPCHYSTFDPRKGGELIFGPSGRDLPQLPLQIGADRILVAGGDFFDPIGPSYGGIRLE